MGAGCEQWGRGGKRRGKRTTGRGRGGGDGGGGGISAVRKCVRGLRGGVVGRGGNQGWGTEGRGGDKERRHNRGAGWKWWREEG